MKYEEILHEAAELIKMSQYAVAFTGAGISAASGIPTFRGKGGIWKTIDPNYFNIHFFEKKPFVTWKIIKQAFYDKITEAKPNMAHYILSVMEQKGFIKSVITQNIDHLHQDAGCDNVIELHGTYKRLVCTKCGMEYDYRFADLNYLPPTCFVCRGVLKPDFIFFNEDLPKKTIENATAEINKADLLLVIGTRAEVFPANTFINLARDNEVKIIEINIDKTALTHYHTSLFIKNEAENTMDKLCRILTCKD